MQILHSVVNLTCDYLLFTVLTPFSHAGYYIPAGRQLPSGQKREVPLMAKLRTLLVLGALAAVAVVSAAVPALTITW